MENNSQENNKESSQRRDPTPWEQLRLKSYFDGILKDEYAERKLHLPEGDTWLRILPPHINSAYDWTFAITALDFDGRRYAHPRTLSLNAVSAYDHALKWIKQCYPHMLRSPSNPAGIRLWPRELGACWVIVQEDGKARMAGSPAQRPRE